MSLKTSSAFMEELSVLELLGKFNFFVPEIQREFVWGKNNRNILGTFCEDIILARNESPDEKVLQQKITKLAAENKFDEIQKLIKEKETGSSLNIGFLYSYKPNYRMEHFPDTGLFEDTYLIDGQQRFTSLFLILFYLSVKEARKADFLKIIRFDKDISTIAFDYRVRSLTHDFIIKLIDEIKLNDDFSEIENSVWFVALYNQDVTIKSMVNALKIIRQKFEIETEAYFDFVLNKIRFWHFKTEKTNQGEELYITMNSRGKQLEENETVRAKLFESIDDESQIFWSEKWEKWQDYFWKNRTTEDNADEGFNEFLKCISGLQAYLSGKKDFVDDRRNILEEHLISNLTLDLIDSYFEALIFVENNMDTFSSQYEYANWVEKFSQTFKELVTSETTNWFVDYEDENKATERRRMVFVWSILLFIKSVDKNEVSINEIFRFIRIFWLRYNNLDRRVSSVYERVKQSINHGVWKESYTAEEIEKHQFYSNLLSNENLLKSFESRIWKIEDHRLNLNGYQVENINCSHLIDFKSLDDFLVLENIYERFVSLFPEEKTEYSTKLNDVLMFYGFYGVRRTPYYYYNYDFQSWRRIIRDLDSNRKVFLEFFKDYDGKNLDDLFLKKKEEFLTKSTFQIDEENKIIICNNLLDTIRLYIILCENIWKHGRSIAYEESRSNISALTTFERKLDETKPFFVIFNTKGNFRGYNFSTLYSMLPDEFIDILKQKVS